MTNYPRIGERLINSLWGSLEGDEGGWGEVR